MAVNMRGRPVIERILAKTEVVPDGCWTFRGCHSAGYPQIWWNRRQWLAHRVTYTVMVAEVPEDLQIDHLCRNKSCVNPAHLEPVTPGENLARAGGHVGDWQRAKTHCPSGHRYDLANTYVTKLGHRICRACNRMKNQEYKRRRAA